MRNLIKPGSSDLFVPGGLFLEIDSIPTSSFVSLISSKTHSDAGRVYCFSRDRRSVASFEIFRREGRIVGGGFSSLSLSISGSEGESGGILEPHEDKISEEASECKEKEENVEVRGSGAMNMTKHLWAGAVAAMVSRSGLQYYI